MLRKSFLIVALFLITSVVYSQDIKNPVSIGPQAGWHKAADADDGKWMFGGALKKNLLMLSDLKVQLIIVKKNTETEL